jgi:signal peptidase
MLYLCSAVVGGGVFGLIWWALENLLLVICSKPNGTIEPKRSVPEKSKPPYMSDIHDVIMDALISEITSTRREKLLALFSTVSGSLLLVDSAITYHLTSSSSLSSWLPVLVQFFVFYCLFGTVLFLTYLRTGTKFFLKGTRIHVQVFAVKRKSKKLIENLIPLFLISTIFGELVAAKVAFNTPTPFGVIEGDSMLPLFQKGDILVVQGVKTEKISVSEVIAFAPPYEYESQYPPLIFHRVIDKIYGPDGEVLFQTKGDNNQIPDPFLVPAKNIYGVQRGLIPYIGWIFIFLRNPIGLAIILLVFVGIFAHNVLKGKLLLRSKTELTSSAETFLLQSRSAYLKASLLTLDYTLSKVARHRQRLFKP